MWVWAWGALRAHGGRFALMLRFTPKILWCGYNADGQRLLSTYPVPDIILFPCINSALQQPYEVVVLLSSLYRRCV